MISLKYFSYVILSTAIIVCGCRSANKISITSQSTSQYKVAVIDLMLLKRQKLGAFQLAKDIGADGLEVDMGGLGNRETFDNQLLKDSVRTQFINKARELDLEIPSLAMTGYYAQSFCQRSEFIKSINDCITTMKLMNVKVAFLPLGVQCDLISQPPNGFQPVGW